MKKLVFLLMAILIAGSAFAVVDPDPDMLGLYFDETADQPVASLDAPGMVTAYLIMTNPSFDATRGFEVGLTPENLTATAVTFPVNALNVGSNDNMIVGFGNPMPTTEATVVATITYFYMNPAAPGLVYMHASEPASLDTGTPAALMADYSILPLGTSVPIGDPDYPALAINYPAGIVAVHATTLDNVKSLYR